MAKRWRARARGVPARVQHEYGSAQRSHDDSTVSPLLLSQRHRCCPLLRAFAFVSLTRLPRVRLARWKKLAAAAAEMRCRRRISLGSLPLPEARWISSRWSSLRPAPLPRSPEPLAVAVALPSAQTRRPLARCLACLSGLPPRSRSALRVACLRPPHAHTSTPAARIHRPTPAPANLRKPLQSPSFFPKLDIYTVPTGPTGQRKKLKQM